MVLIGALLLLLPLGAACHGPQSITPSTLGRTAPTEIDLQIRNRSGAPLRDLPTTLWSSLGTLRLVTQIERHRTRLADGLPFPWTGPDSPRRELLPDEPLATQLSWTPATQELAWREQMLAEDLDALQGWSSDPGWQRAVQTLYESSRATRLDWQALLRDRLVGTFERQGFRVRPSADLVATVVVTDFDWTDTFETGHVDLAATLEIRDPSSAPEDPLVQRQTQLRAEIEVAGSTGTLLDLRPLYPTLATRLADLLLDPSDE